MSRIAVSFNFQFSSLTDANSTGSLTDAGHEIDSPETHLVVRVAEQLDRLRQGGRRSRTDLGQGGGCAGADDKLLAAERLLQFRHRRGADGRQDADHLVVGPRL